MKTKNIVIILIVVLSLLSCNKKEKVISYIQDDRTKLCFAVYDESITCVPCSYLVSYEAYFNYKGKYYPKSEVSK
jgi:hypothetical protein